MEARGGSTKSIEQQERYARLVPEVFVHNLKQPESTQKVVDELHEIDLSRFTENPFPRWMLEEDLMNTLPSEENENRPNTVVIMRHPKDDSLFGFTIAESAERTYEVEDPYDLESPMRLKGLSRTEHKKVAYIVRTVFRESGSGVLKKIMIVLEEELYKKGYRYLDRDAREANGFADSLVRNNQHRIIKQQKHHSFTEGSQIYLRLRILPPTSM